MTLTSDAMAAQREWERWHRIAGVVTLCVEQCAKDVRALGGKLGTTLARNECNRVAELLSSSVEGFQWIKSPYDTAAAEAKETKAS